MDCKEALPACKSLLSVNVEADATGNQLSLITGCPCSLIQLGRSLEWHIHRSICAFGLVLHLLVFFRLLLRRLCVQIVVHDGVKLRSKAVFYLIVEVLGFLAFLNVRLQGL